MRLKMNRPVSTILSAILLPLIGIGLFLSPNRIHAASTQTAIEVMVTPIITVSLTLDTTYYDFGTVELGASTNSATPIVLRNIGNVNVSMSKHAENSADWTVATDSSPAYNKFVLWAATGSARPNLNDYKTDVAVPFDLVAPSLTNLTGILSGTSVSMIPGESVNLWIRLRLPTTSSTGLSQSIPIHFMGDAQ